MADLTCGETGSNGQAVITRINENTNGLATTNDDLNLIATKISGLEELSTFAYDKSGLISNVPETYTTLANINTTLKKGVYLIGISFIYTYPDVTHSVLFRLTTQGVARELTQEAKDITDITPISYEFIYEHTADGTFSLVLESKKETVDSDELDFLEVSMWATKKQELP